MSDEEGWTVVAPKQTKRSNKPRGALAESYDQAGNYPSFGGHQDWKEIKFKKRRQPQKEKVLKTSNHVMTDEQKRMAKLDRAEDAVKQKLVNFLLIHNHLHTFQFSLFNFIHKSFYLNF